MPDDGGANQAADVISRVLAVLDTVSGYTWLGIATAGLLALGLPSPIYGIDLTPLRDGWYGAAIAGFTILASCLWIAKVLRVAHRNAIRAWRRWSNRLVLIPSKQRSFWAVAKEGDRERIQIHAEIDINNPIGRRRSLAVMRVEVARGWTGRYQECHGIYRIARSDGTGGWISSADTGRLVIEHMHQNVAPPKHNRSLLFRNRAIGRRWSIVSIISSKGEGYSQLTFGNFYAFGRA
jgi:hypothetical protein